MHYHIIDPETRRRLALGLVSKPSSKNSRRLPSRMTFAELVLGFAVSLVAAFITYLLTKLIS